MFDDYSWLVEHYGYVTLFSMVFPLAATLALCMPCRNWAESKAAT